MKFIQGGKSLLIFGMVFLCLLQGILAEEKYNFENAEKLKDHIEWREYSPATFEEAIFENKPIFLLLTAPSWCYWCQVYESEDYLFHPDMVSLINSQFIPVYVDADQRVDLTRQYLEGGWPSTTVLSPSRERIFGYSGPRPVETMITNLQKALVQVETSGMSPSITYEYTEDELLPLTNSILTNLISYLQTRMLTGFDSQEGGFGNGQKFPQGRMLDFALDLYEESKNPQFLNIVTTTLEGQYTQLSELETNYNLFDPVEGGFHRYGTTREYTPPHYEKMLYDNARLLRAYYHLMLVQPNNALAQEVVVKSHDFMEREWLAPQGGWYGNSDVHGEDAYYGKNPRPLPKPRVEPALYTHWNAEAIMTYLQLFEWSKNETYKKRAQDALSFFSDEMITEKGAYHYYKDGKKGVTGSLFDNAYLLLAFVEGYGVLEEEEYLETATYLADYSLDILYDWKSGGFFERHSFDLALYAPGDEVRLIKPSEENGIMIYALLQLYEHTGEDRYLLSAIDSFSVLRDRVGTLDRGYYYSLAADSIIQNNLLSVYDQKKQSFSTIKSEELQDFWLDTILDPGYYALEEEPVNSSFVVLIFVAFIAGLLSFISPCTLPILPAYLAYSLKATKKNIFALSVSFFLGLALVFTLLGMSSSALGSVLREYTPLLGKFSGLLIIFLGGWIFLGKSFSFVHKEYRKPTGYLSSFLFGSSFGLAWTPCVGPILVALLVLASTTTPLEGGILLFVYATGLALPLLLLSRYLEKVSSKSAFWKFMKGKSFSFFGYSFHTTSVLSGILFIVLGVLLYTGALYTLNQLVGTSSIQVWLYGIEEWLLSLIQ